jgi:hypothetical protein
LKESKVKFSKAIVILVLVQVFLYTWVHLILSSIIGLEIAPTTSVAFYTFCGAEAGLLAWIRKINKQTEKDDEHEAEYHSEIDES